MAIPEPVPAPQQPDLAHVDTAHSLLCCFGIDLLPATLHWRCTERWEGHPVASPRWPCRCVRLLCYSPGMINGRCGLHGVFAVAQRHAEGHRAPHTYTRTRPSFTRVQAGQNSSAECPVRTCSRHAFARPNSGVPLLCRMHPYAALCCRPAALPPAIRRQGQTDCALPPASWQVRPTLLINALFVLYNVGANVVLVHGAFGWRGPRDPHTRATCRCLRAV